MSFKVSSAFTFEIANGGVYVQGGRFEMYYSRKMGLSFNRV